MKNDKSIAVTGCCGTIGHALLEAIAESGQYSRVLGIDNNESGLFELQQAFDDSFTFSFGDVRDAERLTNLFDGFQTVIHTAALKHVGSCEFSPFEAVKTNINGVENVIKAAAATGVEKVLFTSSDKAANPTNVMGTSKLMGERLMSAAQISAGKRNGSTFFSTRFGNVLGSHGSVFPLFESQIARGGPVTLTDPAMTRFVMCTRDAVNLVLGSLDFALGGEVFVSKMPSLRISDLASVMIERLAPKYGFKPEDIRITITGRKPGEKLYEELLTGEESSRSVHIDRYHVILPAFRNIYPIDYKYPGERSCERGYIYRSDEQKFMSRQEILSYLQTNGLLP